MRKIVGTGVFLGAGVLLGAGVFLVATQPSSAAPAVDTSGYHTLTTARLADKCVDVDARRPFLTACSNAASQHWKLAPLKAGYYTLMIEGRGECLDIVNDGKANNRPILAACGNASGQHWKLTPVGGDYVALTTEWRGDKKCLDVIDEGKALILADCANVSGQRWKIATPERAADSRRELDDDQKTAKIKFTKTMKDGLLKFKRLCGVDLTVTTDFENYSEATWKAQGGSRYHSVGDNCANVVEALLRSCKDPDYDRPSGKPPKATRLACVFAGYKPKRPGDRPDDHFQDNMSFKDGLLTINNAASLSNVEQLTVTVLFQPGGLPVDTGRNGSRCTKSSACHSNNCKAGTCQACSSTVRCATPGDECSSDEGGDCLTPLTPEQTERRQEREHSPGVRTEPKASEGKRLGQSCASDSECNPRYRCKAVSKSRSTCR